MPADRAFIEQMLANRRIAWQVVLTKCDLVPAVELARQHALVTRQLLAGSEGRRQADDFDFALPAKFKVDVGRSVVKRPVLMVCSKTNAGIDVMRRHVQQLSV